MNPLNSISAAIDPLAALHGLGGPRPAVLIAGLGPGDVDWNLKKDGD